MRFCFLLTILLLGLESCFTYRQPQNAEAIQPPCQAEIWVRYVPETDHDAQFRLGVRPVPMDNGWTNLRIERDLSRIAFCGIDVVIIETTPQKLMDNEFLERFKFFGSKAYEQKTKIVLSLVADNNLRLERDNLEQYLEALELNSIPSYLMKNDKPVVLIDGEFGIRDAEHEEAISLMRFGKELPECPDTPLPEVLQPSGEYIWCRAAQCTPQGEWLIKRKRGGSLQNQLDAIRQIQCNVILLSSWNDYSRGDFIENNSLDGESLTRILKKTLN
ncbi:MAG: hypothetical protein MJ106_05795 [Lentisphaeria bacterium]|nr:hypothetical protein [Lentisphaeria bacterium]